MINRSYVIFMLISFYFIYYFYVDLSLTWFLFYIIEIMIFFGIFFFFGYLCRGSLVQVEINKRMG